MRTSSESSVPDTDSAEFWSLPYPSQREAVLGRRVVATSQPLAAQAGLQMMARGGNAVDAAIAAAVALTVVEPTANGIGSDAFALLHDGASMHGLNASGRSPRALDASRLIGGRAMPELGWDAVTVPGAVSAWRALSERFGRLPFAELLEPAIGYATDGYPVSRQTALGWSRGPARFRAFPDWLRTFTVPSANGDRTPRIGEIMRLPDHAATLRAIADSGGDDFYRGALAERIVAAAREAGAAMDAEDLASHTAEWVTPIAVDYRGFTVHEIPPNGQGIATLIGLGALAPHDLSTLSSDCPDTLHLQIEALKVGLADAHRHVTDPAHMRVTAAELLDAQRLADLGAALDPSRAGAPGLPAPRYGGTVLVVAADDEGRAISLIQSNYQGFGSGVVIPGTGIAMQNRGAGFNVEADHPNVVAAGKRPFHTIIPGFVTRNGAPLMAFGVMGGPMQAQGHLQVVSRLADFGQNPQAAIDAPRWQVMSDRRVLLEPGFSEETVAELRARGHEIEVVGERTVRFGGAQAAMRLDGAWLAASDARRDGQAVAF